MVYGTSMHEHVHLLYDGQQVIKIKIRELSKDCFCFSCNHRPQKTHWPGEDLQLLQQLL